MARVSQGSAKKGSKKRDSEIRPGMKNYYSLALLVILVAVSGVIGVTVVKKPASVSGSSSMRLTVYNSGFALVSQHQQVHLYKGANTVLYDRAPSMVEPDSVSVSLSDRDLKLREQSFLNSPVSKGYLLSRFVGEKITGYQTVGNERLLVEGTLLSHSGGEVVLKKEDGSILIVSLSEFELAKPSFEIFPRPTLKWLIEAPSEDDYSLDVSYLTGGLSWEASYSGILDDDEATMDISSWVSLENNAGADFNNARITVVAGSVNRQSRSTQYPVLFAKRDVAAMAEEAAPQPAYSQEALFEYYSYTFEEPTDLPDGSVKQLSFLSAEDVPVEKRFVFDSSSPVVLRSGSQDSFSPVSVSFVFENTEDSNLGFALPSGSFKLYKRSSDGSLEFIGEDSIRHTSLKEEVSLSTGSSFDVLAKKTQTNYERLGSSTYEYSFKVELRNNKDSDVVVYVVEHPYGDWKITSESMPHRKVSQNKVEWAVPVKANSEETLEYTIRYEYG
ncbi:DUF4139 domain-containing protein [Candidatus Woesearchaeota archaeon]|nr:MAG: DUF4139 domain-containing protein [Candidatus Woesearchaeota archaeon]